MVCVGVLCPVSVTIQRAYVLSHSVKGAVRRGGGGGLLPY